MHAVVMASFEEYLSGTLKPAALREIEAHLSNCETCRREVAGMREVSQWFGALKAEEELTPAPGFYARVMREVGHRQAVPSFAGFFALNFAFGRRLVFASLLTLAARTGMNENTIKVKLFRARQKLVKAAQRLDRAPGLVAG